MALPGEGGLTDAPTAPKFDVVQTEVKRLLKDKILVGHAVFNDLSVSLPGAPHTRRPHSCCIPFVREDLVWNWSLMVI